VVVFFIDEVLFLDAFPNGTADAADHADERRCGSALICGICGDTRAFVGKRAADATTR
jgi:hypothetical protein